VRPSAPNAQFQIDEKGLVMAIYPGTPNKANSARGEIMNYQRVVAIAGRMIP